MKLLFLLTVSVLFAPEASIAVKRKLQEYEENQAISGPTTTTTTSNNAAPTTTCNECAICLESGFPNGGKCKLDDIVRCTAHAECRSGSSPSLCKHEFCKDCISSLKESSATNRGPITCPMCRRKKGCHRLHRDSRNRSHARARYRLLRQELPMIGDAEASPPAVPYHRNHLAFTRLDPHQVVVMTPSEFQGIMTRLQRLAPSSTLNPLQQQELNPSQLEVLGTLNRLEQQERSSVTNSHSLIEAQREEALRQLTNIHEVETHNVSALLHRVSMEGEMSYSSGWWNSYFGHYRPNYARKVLDERRA